MSMTPEEARKAMIAKRFGGNKDGAKSAGGVRRKKVVKAKVANTEDKKIAGNLKRLNMQAIPGIEEVNFFKDNGEVIHFVQPKVQAAIASKTFMISGNSETVSLESLMPGILTQMGDLQALQRAAAAQMAAAGAAAGEAAPELAEDDDEAPPELVETD